MDSTHVVRSSALAPPLLMLRGLARTVLMRRDPDYVDRGRAAVCAFALLVTAVALALQIFPFATPLGDDGHSLISLNMAANAQLCGALSHLSGVFDSAWFFKYPELVTVPLRDVIRGRAGSIETYCKSMSPFLNNENSLMLLMRWWLWLAPNSSTASLGRALLLMKVLALATFCYALWWTGMSLPVSGALLVTALVILDDQRTWYYAVYPFVFVLPLLAIALYVLSFRRSVRSFLALGVVATGMGAFSAFGVNMRTSHLPAYLALFGIYAVAVVWHRTRSALDIRRHALMWAIGILAAGFFAGYAAFMYAFIRPLYLTDVRYNASYHVVCHPLVLSLALPENLLSKREGIRWDDSVALELAQRIIPNVTYLGPHYEAALCLYYQKLWMLYPHEMRAIYRAKFQLAGRKMLDNLRAIPSGGPAFDTVAWPVKEVARRIPLLVILLVVTIGSLGVHLKRGRPFALLFALLIAFAAMLQLESSLIMPYFRITYHAYVLFCVVALSLFAAQGILELARGVTVRLAQRGPWKSAVERSEASDTDPNGASAVGS